MPDNRRRFLLIGGSCNAPWQQMVEEVAASLGAVQTVREVDALNLIRQQDYDHILIDAVKVKDVCLLISSIRAQMSDATIVVVTASPTWRRAREAIRAGASDYVRRSMNREQILSVLQASRSEVCRQGSVNNNGEENIMIKATILFADNNADFLDTRSEYLEKAGYVLYKATTFEQAEQILADRRVHLAIIDRRLRDDNDERDNSGLTLAKIEAYRSIPKIILTEFPAYDAVRKALRPAPDGLPPAVEFLDKSDGPEVMMRAVETALAEFMPLNRDLIIRLGGNLSLLHLVDLVEQGTDDALLAERASELEDLFRRLFRDSRQITIERILAQRERGAILAVFAFSEQGASRQFVVACGGREQVQAEAYRYNTFAPRAFGEGSTVRTQTVESVHFAATAYALTGGNLEDMASLAEFYRHYPAEMVTTALTHLLETTLSPWHEGRRLSETDKSLMDLCLARLGLGTEAFSPSALEPRLQRLWSEALSVGLVKANYSRHRLTFHLSDGSPVVLPNPIFGLAEIQSVFSPPVLCGVSLGGLNGNTVLVDRQGRTWLIDFSQTDRGPLLWDFVSLETAIRFDMPADLKVEAQYELEERLRAATRLDEAIAADDLELEAQKALQAISHVRRHAATVIGDKMGAYLAGLLCCIMGRLAEYDPTVWRTRRELSPYLHVLLAAAILCERLNPAPRKELPPAALHSLWIDGENKEVWLEGRQVKLSPQEFDLLVFLFEHKGQLCSRTVIAEQVFDVAYEPEMSDIEKKRMDEGRLNSAMNRLRNKLSTGPEKPVDITSVRGQGYKLELHSWSQEG